MNATTEKQLDMLRHMLGINDPSKRIPEPYRNYAAVEPGDLFFIEMSDAGLVELYKKHGNSNGCEYDYYRCTDIGRTIAIQSFRNIRYPPSSRRYIAFLNVRDCYPDLTFKQFITLPEFKDARQA